MPFTKRKPKPPAPIILLTRNLGAFTAYMLIAIIGLLISAPAGFLGTFLPTTAIGIAFVVYYGYATIPGVLLASVCFKYFLVVNFFYSQIDYYMASALLFGVLEVLQIIFISYVISRFFFLPLKFEDINEIVRFFSLTEFVTAFTSFGMLLPILMVFEFTDDADRLKTTLICVIGKIFGVAAILPLSLLLMPGNGVSLRRKIMVALPSLFFICATIAVFYIFITKLNLTYERTLLTFSIDNMQPALWYAIVVAITFIIVLIMFLIFITGRSEHFENVMNARTKEFLQYQKFLRLVMDTMPNLLTVKNKDRQVVEANKAYFNLFDPSEHYQVLGNTADGMLPPEQIQIMDEAEDKAFKYGLSERIENITDHKNQTVTLLNRRVAFKDDNQDKFILSISTDITELKKKENALMSSNKELEQFASVASHDLQHPLRAATGFMELLETHMSDKIDEKGDKYIKMALSAIHQMSTLIDDLLQYSKLGSQKGMVEKFDASEAFGALETLLSFEIEESNADLIYEDLPHIYYDPEQFSRLIMNIVGNALKYKSDNPPEIYVTAEEKNDFWEFAIKDNGIGIEPKYKDKIFDMFVRLDGSKSKESGTGIGLAVCKKIVERHNGTIWIESEEEPHFSLPSLLNVRDKAVTIDGRLFFMSGFRYNIIDNFSNCAFLVKHAHRIQKIKRASDRR